MGARPTQVCLESFSPEQGAPSRHASLRNFHGLRLISLAAYIVYHEAALRGCARQLCSGHKPDGLLLRMQSKEVSRLNGIYGNILKNNGVEHVEGRAHIKDAHTVQVLHPTSGELLREMTAANILIAVGGCPHRLNVPGAEHTITSDEALALPEQPKRIAIVGAGYIAVEFAGIFSGFGSDVHLFYRKDLPLTSAPLPGQHSRAMPTHDTCSSC
jgi:pyruvate/2-oxoglutarate dehydrogenase complex dihydrolipoamide dehydrogenase (E3) component